MWLRAAQYCWMPGKTGISNAQGSSLSPGTDRRWLPTWLSRLGGHGRGRGSRVNVQLWPGLAYRRPAEIPEMGQWIKDLAVQHSLTGWPNGRA
jgi:hypothetical protein